MLPISKLKPRRETLTDRLHWSKTDEGYRGHFWQPQTILQELLEGGSFLQGVQHQFPDEQTAEFAYAATRVFDTFRGLE